MLSAVVKNLKFEIQKRKIVEHLSNSKHFWTEIKKVNPICKTISNSIEEANGSVEISKLFFEKYRSLYNSVPTSVDDLSSLRDVINRNINVFEKGTITSEIWTEIKKNKGEFVNLTLVKMMAI